MPDRLLPIDVFDQSLGFSVNPLDRLAGRRDAADRVRELADDPAAVAVVLLGDDILIETEGRPWLRLADARALGPAQHEALLGETAGRPHFALALAADRAEAVAARGYTLADLRGLATHGVLPPADLGALAEAKALMHWHRHHRFCARCGAATRSAAAGWRLECAACGTQHFPRTDPVVIMMATDGERCLLGRQPRFPPGMVSCLAGFMEPGETIEDAVRRELAEEAGITTGAVTYLGSQPWPFPASVMIGCLAEATSTDLVIDREELEDARWFSRAEAQSILEGRHPGGLVCPPTMAIANHLMRAWAYGPPPQA